MKGSGEGEIRYPNLGSELARLGITEWKIDTKPGDSDAVSVSPFVPGENELFDVIDDDVPVFKMIAGQLFTCAVSLLMSWLGSRYVRKLFTTKPKPNAMSTAILERLKQGGIPAERLTNLNEAELNLVGELIFPEEVGTRFSDVGGLSELKQSLRELVVLPLQAPEIFMRHELLYPPKGIMLYGPPGTGKTLLARALAKESGANFLNLSPSTLLSKWVGQTNQIVKAVFSLANRVAPCIIFVDEMDALFRSRSAGDHEVYRDMKAEFCQLWDGLVTNPAARVMIIGATNRPYDIDTAILRRMPRTFKVDLPNYAQRIDIMRTILTSTKVDTNFDFKRIAECTESYSGSDITELFRAAMQTPIQEQITELEKNKHTISMNRPNAQEKSSLRALTTDDVLNAKRYIVTTAEQSNAYRQDYEQQSTNPDGIERTNLINAHTLLELLANGFQRDIFAEGVDQSLG